MSLDNCHSNHEVSKISALFLFSLFPFSVFCPRERESYLQACRRDQEGQKCTTYFCHLHLLKTCQQTAMDGIDCGYVIIFKPLCCHLQACQVKYFGKIYKIPVISSSHTGRQFSVVLECIQDMRRPRTLRW